MEYFDVLDENGNKTGDIIERTEAHRLGICHRGIHVWVMNSKNEILLQKRSKNKDICPNVWYVSLAGHISSQENNEQTIEREFLEELGLDVKFSDVKYLYTFHEINTFENRTIIDNEFDDVYLLKRDLNINDLILQEDEVEEVKFLNYTEFKSAIQNEDPTFWIHKIGFSCLFDYLDTQLSDLNNSKTKNE